MRAPSARALASAATTKGVRRLAARPMTVSSGPTPRPGHGPLALGRVVLGPLDRAAPAPPWPPAMTPCTISGSEPKVGGHSAASSTPSRPLVPAPDVEQPAAGAERGHDQLDRAGDVGQLAGHRLGHGAVLGGDPLEDAGDVEGVEVARARVPLLGGEAGELLEAGTVFHAHSPGGNGPSWTRAGCHACRSASNAREPSGLRAPRPAPTVPPCPSCPRSRPCAACWRRTCSAARSARSRSRGSRCASPSRPACPAAARPHDPPRSSARASTCSSGSTAASRSCPTSA